MRMLLMSIIGVMVASILSILVIKPFDQGGKSETPPPVIQQPEPK
ncbi:hypothetical protein [Rhizobium leguminosarum]|nr:hypothetical protein [Rhizobium leguminosarum]